MYTVRRKEVPWQNGELLLQDRDVKSSVVKEEWLLARKDVVQEVAHCGPLRVCAVSSPMQVSRRVAGNYVSEAVTSRRRGDGVPLNGVCLGIKRNHESIMTARTKTPIRKYIMRFS